MKGPVEYSTATIKRITSDFKEMKRYPIEGVAVEMKEDRVGVWSIFLEGPRGTPFENGIYELELTFPPDYPNMPPALRFISSFWHPNVYDDGRVCISILHAPGDNHMDGETFDIRWKPVNSVSSILNSLLLLLMEPNISSPANVAANIEMRDDPEKYRAHVKQLAARAQDSFLEKHSDVFIPHPDTNPGERLMQVDDEESRLKNMATIEVWDSDSGEGDDWSDDEDEPSD